jgi:hypothetical protein
MQYSEYDLCVIVIIVQRAPAVSCMPRAVQPDHAQRLRRSVLEVCACVLLKLTILVRTPVVRASLVLSDYQHERVRLGLSA